MDPAKIPFARKVLEFATNQHLDFRHDQSVFHVSNACGTSACLAGIACMLYPGAGIRLPDHRLDVCIDGADRHWADAGQHLLGLTEGQATDLFWEYDDQAAIDRLRRYIEEAEREQ